MRTKFVLLALTAAATSAQAGEPQPTAAYNWSGVYVGANVGRGVGRNQTTERELNLPNNVFNEEQFSLAPVGALVGLQGGFNWQTGRWVLGLEGDLQWSGQSDASFCGNGCTSYEGTQISHRLPWFATLRGRTGYVVGPALLYATAGFAVANIQTTVSPYDAPPVQYFPFGVNKTNTGWSAGGGVEAAIGGPWTAKVEYLYLDLGEITASGHTGGSDSIGQLSSAIRNHVFRAGLNYQLGPSELASATLQPTQPEIHDWRGFYLGANAGYGVGRNASVAKFVDFGGDPVETFTQSPAGGLIGGDVGYNWEYGKWLIGIEGDLQYASQTSASCLGNCLRSHSLTVDQSIQWLGSVRGRVGHALSGSLVYMTGGLAYGGVGTSGLLGQTTTLPKAPYGASTTQVGWTLGGGIETPLSANWSLKAEYLFIDLGNTGQTKAATDDGEGFPAVVEMDSRVHDHIIRAGLNYKFER